MSPRKLNDSDKQEILELYRTPQETTSTLAERYQVSSSTISRFLKSSLAENEYEELIQQKRLSRTPSGAAQILNQLNQQQEPGLETDDESDESSELGESGESSHRRRRRRSSAVADLPRKRLPAPKIVSEQPSLFDSEDEDEDDETDVHALEEMLGEDIGALDDEDEEWESDDDDDDEDSEEIPHTAPTSSHIQVLPLSEASFPRTCYLVVDRAAELIALPLKEFGDLGQIPAAEVQQKTLPVFDNHRVARRFSNRSQRVIKVPDGRLLEKVGVYLQAKGITRLLISGQVYAVSS